MTESVIKFECPATCIVAGASGSGQTSFIFEVLKDAQLLFKKIPRKIIYCNSTYQPLYVEMKTRIELMEFFFFFFLKDCHQRDTWLYGL